MSFARTLVTRTALIVAIAACSTDDGGKRASSPDDLDCADGQLLVWESATEAWVCGDLPAETDPVFSASALATVTSAQIASFAEAHAWGNHADAGYLLFEDDPTFTVSPAALIASTDLVNWDSAFAWGNHAAAGYLTAEADPLFAGSPSAGITSTQVSNWNQTFAWGNHATAGYLTSLTGVAQSASYQLLLRAASAGAAATGDHGVWINGSQVQATTRSYGLVEIDRATGATLFNQSYDVFADIAEADALAARLASSDATRVVIVTTFDEPQANRLGTGDALRTQILRCGGTAERFDAIATGGAYLLVGSCGGNAGSGYEQYSGVVSGAQDAAVEASFRLVDGELEGLPPRVLTLAPTAGYVLNSTNVFGPFPDLTTTFTLTRPTLVHASYSVAIPALSQEYLVTRLAITREEGAVDRVVHPRESQDTSLGTYWSNRGSHTSTMGPGTYTVEVHYRTVSSGLSDPSTNWQHRQLTLRLEEP